MAAPTRSSRRVKSGRPLLLDEMLSGTKTFPQDRGFIGAIVVALDRLLTNDGITVGAVVFLQR